MKNVIPILVSFMTLSCNMYADKIVNNYVANNYLNNNTAITANEITTLTAPIIIDDSNSVFAKSSRLIFSENVIFKPASNYTYSSTYTNYPAAIIVAKSNIIIDLAGYTLSLDQTTSTSKTFHGIAIMPGVENVKIISSSSPENKGIITGFYGYGIYASGSAKNHTILNTFAGNIKNVFIDNLLLTENKSGIYMNNVIRPIITDVQTIYNYATTNVYGIYFSNVTDGMIKDNIINLNTSFLDVYGIYAYDTIGVMIESVQTNFNKSNKTGNAYGIAITGSSLQTSCGNKIFQCKASANACAMITGKESVGFLLGTYSHHNVIEKSLALAQTYNPNTVDAPTITTYPKYYGIKITNSTCNQITENRCAYNSYGFIDTAKFSSSCYIGNVGLLNKIANYTISVTNSENPNYPRPLPKIALTIDDLVNNQLHLPVLMNIEIK
jgi:hypothetical protein